MNRIKKVLFVFLLVYVGCTQAMHQDLCKQMTQMLDKAYAQTIVDGRSTVIDRVNIPYALTYEALSFCGQQYHKKNPAINSFDYNLNVKLEEKEITIFMSQTRIYDFLQTHK